MPMPTPMTVGQLRALLSGYDDDQPVMIEHPWEGPPYDGLGAVAEMRFGTYGDPIEQTGWTPHAKPSVVLSSKRP